MKGMPCALCAGVRCLNQPSYGVMGSKKMEFCSQHAKAEMVDVLNKKCSNQGCSKRASCGVAGTKKAEFCSQHKVAEMVDVVSKKCNNSGCSKKPSYGVAGTKKAEFCSQHAKAEMVDVVNKRCDNLGCSRKASYGVAGSRKAEFCSQHAKTKMVDVVRKKCGNQGCSKQPMYGVVGSKKTEFCSQHAQAEMVDVVNKKCGNPGCPKRASYGVAGRKAEFCSQHKLAEMGNVVSKKCDNPACSKKPSYGVAGSRTPEFCSQHAQAEMVDVVNKKCGNPGCPKRASYCVAGRKAEFCSQHVLVHRQSGNEGCSSKQPSYGVAGTRAGMVHFSRSKFANEGCVRNRIDVHGIHARDLSRQHAVEQMANVSDAKELVEERDNSVRDLTKAGDGDADEWGRKRSHPDGAGSDSIDGVGSHQSVRASTRRRGTMLELVTARAIAGVDSVFGEADALVKVEVVSPLSPGIDGQARGDSESTAPWIGCSSVGGSSRGSRGVEGLGSMTILSGHSAGVDDVVFGEAEAEVSVKLETGAPTIPSGICYAERVWFAGGAVQGYR